MKVGKKYAESVKSYDRTKAYDTTEAVNLALATAKAKFDETIELPTTPIISGVVITTSKSNQLSFWIRCTI